MTPLSVLIAVTHLLGVGHLSRAATLARALAGRGHKVTLVSGGRPAPLVRTGAARLVQLPPVHIVGTQFGTLRGTDGEPVSAAFLEVRKAALLCAFAEASPDVVVTELFPFGRRVLSGEFLALLDAARQDPGRTLVLASVRDVLARPKHDRVADAHARLHAFYDGVLVHSDPSVIALDASWPVGPELSPLLHYTGYMDEAAPPGASPAPAPTADTADEIVVSGGGSGAGLRLYETAIEAARLLPGRRWRLLAGGALDEASFRMLGEAAPGHVTVERARPDFRALLDRAALSVSQAGYNTMLDVLAARVRAVVVPFEDGQETEQRQRADAFAARGLVTLLPAADLTAATLAATVERALAAPRLPASVGIDTGGAVESARLVEAMAARKLAAGGRRKGPSPAWAALDDALARLADAGQVLRLWWRDDDAVAPTPALDRLVALARDHGAPLALAVIPAQAEAALADRLADAPDVTILVHGLRHENHAPPGEKKAEFGAHRPLDTLAAEAGAGLALLSRLAGPQLLPVLVPPWNRIAPALVARLGALGYRGLSVSGERSFSERPGTVTEANVHVDPIDWHGSRSLADETIILGHLVGCIENRLSGTVDPAKPAGLLTHHLVQDAMVWRFCETLLTRLSRHTAVQMTAVQQIFQ